MSLNILDQLQSIRCPHCNELHWKAGEDKESEINILMQMNCPFIPFECDFCDEMFLVRSVIVFEVSKGDDYFVKEFSNKHHLTRIESNVKIE